LQPISDETGRGVVLDPLPAVVRVEAPTTTLAAAILVLAASSTLAVEWIIEGRVVGVSDGDTITVLDDSNTQHKIRFTGIDAPEKGQAFGERSKQGLSIDRVHRTSWSPPIDVSPSTAASSAPNRSSLRDEERRL
jgi:hypothetical protein